MTWVSCAQAVLMCGLKPVLSDVNLDSMIVTAENISHVISPRTKAIMVVHYSGLLCDMNPMIDLGLPVIEDDAHATDSYYKGRSCGGIGDIGIYSFDAVKNLTATEVGGITFRAEDMMQSSKNLSYCSIGKSGFDSAESQSSANWWGYNISERFIKMLPTSLHTAVAIEQLKRLDKLQARRKEVWDFYDNTFKNLSQVIPPKRANLGDIHGSFTCIQCKDRDGLAEYLLSCEIYKTVKYHPLHLNALYDQMNHALPNAEVLNKTALSLPLHPRPTDSDVIKTCETLIDFYK